MGDRCYLQITAFDKGAMDEWDLVAQEKLDWVLDEYGGGTVDIEEANYAWCNQQQDVAHTMARFQCTWSAGAAYPAGSSISWDGELLEHIDADGPVLPFEFKWNEATLKYYVDIRPEIIDGAKHYAEVMTKWERARRSKQTSTTGSTTTPSA